LNLCGMKKTIKRIGATLVTSGFLLFIASLFTGSYTLTEKTLNHALSGLKHDVVIDLARKSPLLDKKYDLNASFIRDLSALFQRANDTIIAMYTINEQDIATLLAGVDRGTRSFDAQWIDRRFGKADEINEFKSEAFKAQMDQSDGKTFKSREELKQELLTLAQKINRNIKYQRGFDDYTIKTLMFDITKASGTGPVYNNIQTWQLITFGFWILGGLLFFYGEYHHTLPGIKNDGVFKRAVSSRGSIGIALGGVLISFYVLLYFYPEYITNWVVLVDPLSRALNGGPASHWFLYGFLYTLAVLVMGIRMIYKYRHSKYQLLRTFSVMFFQLAFAFVIPEILMALNQPAMDFKNIWPLDYDFFYSYNLAQLMSSGTLGWFMLIWGIALIVIAVPVVTYFYGKRWYCSWVCGCGALAENLGDPFRQLSDKSLKAWKIERWLVHGVLVYAIINTVGVLYTYFTNNYTFLGIPTEWVKTSYGFLISSIFAGVVGTGFYPLMGNRVWCRFGCPLAAYLGIVQKFKSRFRITTNGGQCISCGNCSTYCEMGIDVRWYAQRGQNIIRASCVGCGICAAVCPRGVLRLENGPEKGRYNRPGLLGNQHLPPATEEVQEMK